VSTFTELVTNLNRMSQETPDLKFSEHDMDNYWDDLSEREREKAFYCVVKKLNQARKDKLSYRNTLYDEFEFDPNMYSMSISSGFMELFNSYQTENDTQHVQRLEIIDEAGKANISMQISKCKTSIDDNGTTVKLIVTTDQED
tara:strand:- start:321 stop:749 length:429 start_codon:yes stop_codon:yes gene_type:complete